MSRWRSGLLILLLTLVPAHRALAAWEPGGTPICTAAGPQGLSNLCSDGQDGALIAWIDDRDTASAIYAQRIDGDGRTQWTENGVRLVPPSPAVKYVVGMLPDGVGGALVLSLEGGDVHMLRLGVMGATLWRIQLSSSFNTRDARMVSDGAGGAIVGWTENHTDAEGLALGAKNPYWVKAQRVDGEGRLLWNPAGEVVGRAGTLIGLSVLAEKPDPPEHDPGVILTWVIDHLWTGWDLVAQRLDSNGQPRWLEATEVCERPGSQTVPAPVPDGQAQSPGGAEGAIIAWHDGRTTLGDVLAQRIDENGKPLWNANGVPVGQAQNAQVYPAAVSDLAGGAIIAWRDERGHLFIGEAFVNRVDGSGNRLWGPSGQRLSGGTRLVHDVLALPDGLGGVLLVWADDRGASRDIRAQHVSREGAELWVSGGAMVSSELGDQYSPAALPVGWGDAIVSWTDTRSGESHIYASRISAGTGGVVGVDLAAPSGSIPTLRVLAPRPSPARGAATIAFEIASARPARVEVFDVAGRLVRRLDAGQSFPAGLNSIAWDGHGASGGSVAAGMYVVAVTSGGETASRRIIYLPR